MSHQREADAEASMRAPGRAATLAQTIEDVGQEVRANPLPCVADRDLDVRVHALNLDLDSPALARELDRVAQEIPHYLLEPARVPAHGRPRRFDDHLEPDVLRVRGRPAGIHRLFDDRPKIDG